MVLILHNIYRVGLCNKYMSALWLRPWYNTNNALSKSKLWQGAIHIALGKSKLWCRAIQMPNP